MKYAFYLLTLGVLLTGCGKDDSSAGSPAGAAETKAAPTRDFANLSGIAAETDGPMVCPYEELGGYYKLASAECSSNGAKADLDYQLVPTRYSVGTYSDARDARGYIELQYTRDGSDVPSQALDFPRLPGPAHAKTLGLQCGASADGETLTLKQACPGTSGKDCFYSVVRKGGRVSAITSQVRKGVQYWCKVNLRKADPVTGQ